jgi:hypothetical protein
VTATIVKLNCCSSRNGLATFTTNKRDIVQKWTKTRNNNNILRNIHAGKFRENNKWWSSEFFMFWTSTNNEYEEFLLTDFTLLEKRFRKSVQKLKHNGCLFKTLKSFFNCIVSFRSLNSITCKGFILSRSMCGYWLYWPLTDRNYKYL